MSETVLFATLSIVLVVTPVVTISYVVLRFLGWLDARREARAKARKAARDLDAERGVYLNERSFLKACSNCDVFAFTLPFRDDQGRTFCSAICRDYVAARRPDFCKGCVSDTLDTQVHGRLNDLGMGWSFGGPGERCPSCQSAVRTLWFRLFLIPLVPAGTYRTIRTSPYHYAGRRIR